MRRITLITLSRTQVRIESRTSWNEVAQVTTALDLCMGHITTDADKTSHNKIFHFIEIVQSSGSCAFPI